MPHLFALQGPGNCGKSNTLNRLYQSIQTKHPSTTFNSFYGNTKDVAFVIHGVNGLVIGIESQGDPNSRVKKSLPAFTSANCDIIYCARRTSGMTVDSVNALSGAYNIQFVPQNQVPNNFGGANAATATSLMAMAGI